MLARANYGRWPEKSISDLYGKPVFQWTLEKVLHVGYDRVIVSTTDRPEDRCIVDIAGSLGATIEYGPPNDRSERIRQCIEKYKPEYCAVPIPNQPFFDLDMSQLILSLCRDNPGHEIYSSGSWMTHQAEIKIYHTSGFQVQEQKEKDREQYLKYNPSQRAGHCYVYDPYDERIRNRYLIDCNIAYPLHLDMANEVCRILGHFPRNYDEVISAYTKKV
jgi:spore coat polysaccharide biosynthesis protein SpsF (cytidylyltransferase family)